MEVTICGLIGEAGDLRFTDEFTIKRLLLADYFRGPDSTGLASIRIDGSAVLSKIASNPIDLFGMEQFKRVLNGNASRAFIGHNRAATRGAVTTVNAHPFHVEHIVGAHNGTLCQRGIDALETALDEKFSVDSLALFTAIAKLGIEKTMKLIYEGRDQNTGAWALSWYDQNEGTLNFLRNKHRPLMYCYIKDPLTDKVTRMMWASEWWMMREAIESSTTGKYEVWTKPDTNVGYLSFEEDIHYKYDLLALKEGALEVPKPKVKKLKGKDPNTPVKQKKGQRGDPFGRDKPPNYMGFQAGKTTVGTHTGTCGNQKSTGSTKSGTNTQRGNSPSDKRIICLTGDAKHPYANIVDEEKFVSFMDNNNEIKCAWCKADVTYGEPGITIYEKEAIVLCRDCTGHKHDTPYPNVKIFVKSPVFDQLL
jgi:hypothetical protein